ncbi:MAG: 16S rRNA processing protein RimM [Lachnospiraceae bacterium]|nr:16S rRNA processing protein RimM [Lachnospiraceae bacterium]
MEDLLQVGILSSTHGVRGEIKVFPTTDDVKRFKKNKEYILGTKNGNMDVRVESVKFFKQFVILKFEGIDTLDDILAYKGCSLYVNRAHAVKLQKDEYFIADLIGMEVFDEDENYIGKLTDVLETGANDVYEITTEDEKTYLFPAIKECIKKVDMDNRKITAYVMPGLMEDITAED